MSSTNKLFNKNNQNKISYVRKDINIFLPIIKTDNLPEKLRPLIGYFNSKKDKFHDIITDVNYPYNKAKNSITIENIEYAHASIRNYTLYPEDDIKKSIRLIKEDHEYSFLEALRFDMSTKHAVKYKHLYKFDEIENIGLVKRSLIKKMYNDLIKCVYPIYKTTCEEIKSENNANDARKDYNINF